jgi:hypothetical protein
VANAVRITGLHFAGKDEYVEITNHGPSDQSLTGWALYSDGQKNPFRFPEGYVLPAGAYVRVHSGPEATDNPPTDLKWSGAYYWNDKGDEATLYDAEGRLIDRWAY